MNDKPVINVQRKGLEAHHFVCDSETSHPINVGDMVKCKIDWKRRHDHMQQHSGLNLENKAKFRNLFKLLFVSMTTRSTLDIGHITARI